MLRLLAWITPTTLLTLPAALQLCGCCCGDAWEQAKIDAELAEQEREADLATYKEAAERRAASYRQVHAAIDPGALETAVACPEADIRTARGEDAVFRSEILSVDHGSLPGASVADAAQWTWLNHTYLGDLERIAAGDQEVFEWNYENTGTPERRYLAVIVPTDTRAMPSNYKKGFLSGPSFDGGWFVGSVVIVDLDAGGAVLCHAPFNAENSEVVDVGSNQDEEKAIEKDFKHNVEDAAQTALEGITEQLKVNFVGIF